MMSPDLRKAGICDIDMDIESNDVKRLKILVISTTADIIIDAQKLARRLTRTGVFHTTHRKRN